MDLTYHMPTKILYGTNAVLQHDEVWASMGKCALLVTGKRSAKESGALAQVETVLTRLSITYAIFDEIGQNPKLSDCHRAGEKAREIGADFIVGIGGGSPLDAAKAISVFAAQEMEPMEVYDLPYAKEPLPMVLIGTTAGTGSEVTPYAVITVDTQGGIGRKRTVGNLFAKVCFADPQFTESLPYSFTVSTALDAFSHCVEGYFSANANTLSDVFALEGIKRLAKVLPKLQEGQPITSEQREELYVASLYGGLTITKTGTCFCHGMGYFLTEEYGVAHGRACAVYLPDFMALGAKGHPEKAERLYNACQMTSDDLNKLLRDHVGALSVTLTDAQKETLYERWKTSLRYAVCPGDFDWETAKAIANRLF